MGAMTVEMAGLAGVRTILGNRARAAAFLCYHSVADNGPPFLSVPPDLFERQMASLRRLGWRSGSSEQLRELIAGRRPAHPLVFLTFDDGFADNEHTALPIMRSYGMSPIVFVLPPSLAHGAPLAWPEVTERQRAHPDVMRSMDWPAVERMVESGAEIASHGLTHRSLDSLHGDELREELVDSRRVLRERLGRCDAIAYPFGHWNRRVAMAAADAGYAFAFSIPRNGQLSAGLHAIPRVPVDHRDDERRLAFKLSPGGRQALLSPLLPLARSVMSRTPAMSERSAKAPTADVLSPNPPVGT